MDFLISLFSAVSPMLSVNGAMEFADDNRPRVSFEKHLEYQKKLQTEEKESRISNRLVNYNINLDLKEHPEVAVLNANTAQYFIVEPRGYENDKLLFYARAWCEDKFSRCTSLTQNHMPLGILNA